MEEKVSQLVAAIVEKQLTQTFQSRKGDEKFLFDAMGADVGRLMSHGFIKSWPKNQSSLHVLRHMLLWPSFPLYVKTFCKCFILVVLWSVTTYKNISHHFPWFVFHKS